MDDAALCQEKLSLLHEFQEATRFYSSRVAAMAEIAGMIPAIEFEVLSSLATQAHEKCAAPRDLFYGHVKKHGC